MLRRLNSFGVRWLFPLALLVANAAAADLSSLSGFVKDTRGVPQIGALIEIASSAALHPITTISDDHGRFTVKGLTPGTYTVRASAESFLPSLRENISVRNGANVMVVLTLNTLFEAMQLLPAQRRTTLDDDDWKWTLRSPANRPILRFTDEAPVVVSHSDDQNDRVLKARVEFIAGSDGDTNSPNDMATGFSVEQAIFDAGTFKVTGHVAYDMQTPSGVLRTSYSQKLANGDTPEIAILWRQFAPITDGREPLRTMSANFSNNASLGSIEMHYGGEMDFVQASGQALGYKPYASITDHLSPDTVIEYAYSSSEPTPVISRGTELMPADLVDAGPRFSFRSDGSLLLERAAHQEISISRRVGNNSFQVAGFYDMLRNAALNGVGYFDASAPDTLAEMNAGQFWIDGRSLSTSGARIVYTRKINSSLSATVDYSYGGVLAFPFSSEGSDVQDAAQSVHQEKESSVAVKVNGTIARSKTQWMSSYRFTSNDALTVVDQFNASPGRTDAYWSLFLRQPLPSGWRLIPGHVEALVDIRNLLAQGYHPVLGLDGHTIYLVQAPRTIRAGLEFIF